jgi:hypothetical protein
MASAGIGFSSSTGTNYDFLQNHDRDADFPAAT